MAKLHRQITWSIFLLVFLLELTTGYYVAHIKGFLYADAISRVANSFYVLYTQPPHLAAIGGVWNPFPSLCELPFMLLWRIYKPIATSGLAGVIFSSVFAAGSGALIYRSAVSFGLSVATGICLALLYCLHPFIFVYGFNGMTEVPFSFMLLWLIFSFTQWLEDGAPFHLVMMALALMLAFLIRYEAIPVSVIAFAAVTVITLTVHRRCLYEEQGLDWNFTIRRLEGESIILLAPVLYAFFVWVLFCWIVLGNPLYFMNSGYSITAFAREYAANATLKSLMGHSWSVCQFIFFKTRLFMIPLLIILWYRLWKRKFWQWDFLILLLFVISTNILQFIDLRKGLSAGWLRYFIYPFPFLVAWLPYEMKKVNTRFFTVLAVITLLCADLVMGFAWFDPSPTRVGWEEFNHLNFQADSKDVAQKEVAQYINNRLPHARILMDSAKTYLTIMNTNRPWLLVLSSSYQFAAAVKNPRRYHIDYVLIPSTTDTDPYFMDVINKRYSTLYNDGADWCVLAKKFGKYYNLYRVKPKIVKTPVIVLKSNINQTSAAPNAVPIPIQASEASPTYNTTEPKEKSGANASGNSVLSRRDPFPLPKYNMPTNPTGNPSAPNQNHSSAREERAISPFQRNVPPDLAEIFWEGVIATSNDQIIMIHYLDKHYQLHIGDQLPGTSYIVAKLNQDSVTLSASGKLQLVYKKGINLSQ